ncbi:MAG: LPS assembly lipoprotein LptE [Gammaproteobacteria bacterium]
MTRSALLFALLCVSACGFHLRGTVPADLQFSRVYVREHRARRVAAELARQLSYNRVVVAPDATSADVVVELRNERFDERVLSVDPRTGKAREYQIAFRVDLAVRHADRRPLIKNQALDLLRDFTFDETAALGKFEEQQVLREEMIEDAAETVLRRLESVRARPAQAAPSP